jgi:hypothetical protein
MKRMKNGEFDYSTGVSQENQDKANKLMDEGNHYVKLYSFEKAANKFREALKYWDHPAARYNVAYCLAHTDQPVEMKQHLEAAITMGIDNLDKVKAEYAKSYLAMLKKKLVNLTVTCKVPGASVEVDGVPVLIGPGEYSGTYRAGPHSIVATKPGSLPSTTSRDFQGGDSVKVDIPVVTLEEVTGQKRRWARWKPWSVVAGGAALAITGGVLHYSGHGSLSDFDDGVKNDHGSTEKSSIGRANRMQKTAMGSYIAGGAAMVTGAVLVLMNQPKPALKEYGVKITPMATESGPGAAMQLNF